MQSPVRATRHRPSDTLRTRSAAGRLLRTGVVAAVGTALAGTNSAAAPRDAHPIPDRTARIEALIDAARAAADHAAPETGADTALGGPCVSLATCSILFEPAATESHVQTTLEGLPDPEFGLFIAGGAAWTATATNGPVSPGQPLTITYSFVPDGTPIFISITQNTVPSNLFTTLDNAFPGGRAAWQTRVRAAFNRFSEFSNITYVEVSDDGAPWPTAPGAIGARGDVRICMCPIGDGPLAVNFFPAFGGDMMLDSLDAPLFASPADDFRAFRNVLMHEHGHGVGLDHVIPQNGTKLMEPVLNTGFDGPQEDDIRGVQHLYGDAHEAKDTTATATFLGGPLRPVAEAGVQTFSVAEAALERAGASDFYSFTALSGAPIAIRVQPVGTTYLAGPQFVTPSPSVHARATRDLALRLWRRVNAQTGQFSLVAQINFNDAGEAEYHPPIPYALAGFMVAEVFSTDGVNDVQRYSLTIRNAAIDPPVEHGTLRVFADGVEMDDDHTLLFGSTNVGASRTQTIQITNAGTGVLTLGTPSIAGPAAADFSFSLPQQEVQPGGLAAMAVDFSPTAPGQRVAVVTLPNSDPDRANFSFIVSGTAVGVPQLEVQINGTVSAPGSTFDFADVGLGSDRTAGVVLRNTGTAALNVTSISLQGPNAGDFAFGALTAAIPAGGQLFQTLTFSPAAAGPRTAQLRFVSNSVPTGFNINLTGEGVEPITDCNANGVADETDIATGASGDCDADGVPDECQVDADADGVIDPCDQFPGQDDRLDTDGDGTVDAVDNCPQDANKTQPGPCGCGVAETDSDLDGTPDCLDAFPNDPNDGTDEGDPLDGNEELDPLNGDNGQNPIDRDDDQDPINAGDDDDARTIPPPCGFGVFPALLATGLSLVSGRQNFCRRRR
jgi:hypothetical protein